MNENLILFKHLSVCNYASVDSGPKATEVDNKRHFDVVLELLSNIRKMKRK